jgi:hypothetical protein
MEAIVTIEPTLGEPGLIGYEVPKVRLRHERVGAAKGASSRFQLGVGPLICRQGYVFRGLRANGARWPEPISRPVP